MAHTNATRGLRRYDRVGPAVVDRLKTATAPHEMRSCFSFNLQERGNGFGPLDRPMSLHCINKARLRRTAPLKAESILIAVCLNTEYHQDQSGIRQ